MNIFFTSNCPVECAKYLDDKRIVKMCLETAQMLSTALYETNSEIFTKHEFTSIKSKKVKEALYYNGIKIPLPTHKNHPSNVWARQSQDNFMWLCQHFKALLTEYTNRYNKIHKCSVLYDVFIENKHVFSSKTLTPFVNCAANAEHKLNFKHMDNVHDAYKEYLKKRWKTDKRIPTFYKKPLTHSVKYSRII